jgi:hypothetical protein
MITLFTIPKPFRGHSAVIQRNAIRSWLALRPECEIVLFGDDEGVAEVAAEFNVRHVSNVPTNEYGTPLLDFVFEHAQQLARYDLVCYINADVMLLDDFLPAIRQIRFDAFLMSGRHWGVALAQPWDFENNNWEERLRDFVTRHGTLGPPGAIDYFVFPRGALGTLPPFAVGRPGWDNWVIYRARFLRLPVIDVTQMVTAIHQNHGYGHVRQRTGEKWEGPEAERNRELMAGSDCGFNLTDTNWVLTPRGLRRPPLTRERLDLFRWMRRLSVLYPRLGPVISAARGVWRRGRGALSGRHK